MEIIVLQNYQFIKCDVELVKITIGNYDGHWALETETVKTRSGCVCPIDEACEVRGDYYHEDEFDDYGIVFDHYSDGYEFEDNCVYGYVGARGSEGHFSRDCSNWIECNDIFYMNEEIAEYYSVYYCGDCDRHYDSNNESCNCDENEYCFEYHSDYREDYSKGSIYKIGFEIEKEDSELRQYEYAEDLFENTGWAKERDGSLGTGGFELISPILPLDITVPIYEQEEMLQYISKVAKYINADYSKNCGGHINISKAGIPSSELLASIGGYLPLFYSIYRNRVDNDYSKAHNLKSYLSRNQGKHVAFHCRHNEVIELRIFPAVKNVDNLLWRTELLRLMLAHPTNSYKTALVQIANPKNALHQHLLKVFDKNKLFEKVKAFTRYAAYFEQVYFKQKTINHNLGKIYKVA